ncbi:helix-turn-helix domain-containing protein [Pseudovibrio sp. Tun.PSC04-5.I4]|nr:helix-turn-helix domain-containing protein [Pseudovibrio sp. Tun.PSC04-5.I4]
MTLQQKQEALVDLDNGVSISATARKYHVSRQTIMRLRDSRGSEN